jgi:ADP-ribose pyrophosphatase
MVKSILSSKFYHADHKIITKERLYDGFFKIDRFELQHELFAGGKTPIFSRELFERGEASAVLLYDKAQDVVVLTEQYRIGAAFDKNQSSPW